MYHWPYTSHWFYTSNPISSPTLVDMARWQRGFWRGPVSRRDECTANDWRSNGSEVFYGKPGPVKSSPKRKAEANRDQKRVGIQLAGLNDDGERFFFCWGGLGFLFGDDDDDDDEDFWRLAVNGTKYIIYGGCKMSNPGRIQGFWGCFKRSADKIENFQSS